LSPVGTAGAATYRWRVAKRGGRIDIFVEQALSLKKKKKKEEEDFMALHKL